MRAMNLLASAVVLSITSYGVALAQDMPAAVKVSNGMLTSAANGKTLYTWDDDKIANKSACNAGCTSFYPVFAAEDGAMDVGDWKVITRIDKSKQWAYKGKPLYYFSADTKPGDVTGDPGYEKRWHIAKP